MLAVAGTHVYTCRRIRACIHKYIGLHALYTSSGMFLEMHAATCIALFEHEPVRA